MTITVVDYGAGNIGSVLNMLKKIAVPVRRGATVQSLHDAERLLLPGVGAFDFCMERLEQAGLVPALRQAALEKQIPVLGICVGFQMMFARSDEGSRAGLGWLGGEVKRFDAARLPPGQKIPHMGWNDIVPMEHAPLLAGIERPRFYFVHSYHAVPAERRDVIAECRYGYDFCCAARRGNIYGVQFHPEKSHRYGMQLLRNFASL